MCMRIKLGVCAKPAQPQIVNSTNNNKNVKDCSIISTVQINVIIK